MVAASWLSDPAIWISLASASAAIAATVAAWMSRHDFLKSEARREESEGRRQESELKSETEKRRFELDAADSRRMSAEALASLAKAFVEAKEREKEPAKISEISPAKRARMRFAETLLAWVDTFDRTVVESEELDFPEQFHRFGSYARDEFEDNGAYWLTQWMLGLVVQLYMGIGARSPATQEQVSTASDQMRYLIRAWVEDPDLFNNLTPSGGTIGW